MPFRQYKFGLKWVDLKVYVPKYLCQIGSSSALCTGVDARVCTHTHAHAHNTLVPWNTCHFVKKPPGAQNVSVIISLFFYQKSMILDKRISWKF